MNKMVKGAAVAGLGVALLLGGGGTLAVWNASTESEAGAIVSGDLNLTTGAGIWTSNLSDDPTTEITITDYNVIPGETLTYTQPLTVTLVGDQMAAKLAVSGTTPADGFEPGTVEVTTQFIGEGAVDLTGVPMTESADPYVVQAVTTFEFLESTSGRQSVGATYDFAGVAYTLTQQAPGQN